MENNIIYEKRNNKDLYKSNSQVKLKLLIDKLEKLYPENKKRKVNKILHKNQYFKFEININTEEFIVKSIGDLMYSAIPYDTAREYIQIAAMKYVKDPDKMKNYIIKNKNIITTYIQKALFQLTNNSYNVNDKRVEEEYSKIFTDHLFMIQVIGRIFQHKDRGPLSATLPFKFLYEENLKTGISAYVFEYIMYMYDLSNNLPISMNNYEIKIKQNFTKNYLDSLCEPQSKDDNFKKINLIKLEMLEKFLENNDSKNKLIDANNDEYGIYSNKFKELILLNGDYLKPALNFNHFDSLLSNCNPLSAFNPLLKSKYGKTLSRNREKYIAHSINPFELRQYFRASTIPKNENKINVISDIHADKGIIPFKNENFNIFAGDITKIQTVDKDIKGIYVIGNSEIVDILINEKGHESKKWKKYSRQNWFRKFLKDPTNNWTLLPVNDKKFYQNIKNVISNRFPCMNVLNNESMVYNGIRYIGLTLPVFHKDKKLTQIYLFEQLSVLLGNDREFPTIIVSHVPLFSELSIRPKLEKDNEIQNMSLYNLFKDYNIKGVIHGHHHIASSKGNIKYVEFADKKIFVICSIFSENNTGIELLEVLNNYNCSEPLKIEMNQIKEYTVDDNIVDIVGMHKEKRKIGFVYRVEKNIHKKKYKKIFRSKKDAIDYLNMINSLYNKK